MLSLYITQTDDLKAIEEKVYKLPLDQVRLVTCCIPISTMFTLLISALPHIVWILGCECGSQGIYIHTEICTDAHENCCECILIATMVTVLDTAFSKTDNKIAKERAPQKLS